MRVPTPSQAARSLAGHAEFDYAEGYPSAFVVQLFRLLAEYPDELPPLPTALGPWIAARTADGAVLGALSCSLVGAGPDASAAGTEGSGGRSGGFTVSVGYDVAPGCEGQGYATEMVRLVCDHLLGQPGVVRVCADTEADHTASRRVMEKAGMSRRRDETVVRNGRERTVVYYAIDRCPLS